MTRLYKVTRGIPGLRYRSYGFIVEASRPREAADRAYELAKAVAIHRGNANLGLEKGALVAEQWAMLATDKGGQRAIVRHSRTSDPIARAVPAAA